MGYAINPSCWSAVFPVPAQVVDDHIRLANGDQLKVLLYLLRHCTENPDMETLCKALRMKAEDTQDYLQYWINSNILLTDLSQAFTPAASPSVPMPAAVAQEKETVKAPAPQPPKAKPDSEQLAVRAEESPEIRFLFQHAQEKLGRTVGYDGQCVLLWMHDSCGLPVEVILMLLEYSVSVCKTNMQYLEAIGRDWGEKEIDSIEKADAQITALRHSHTLWRKFAAMAGIATPRPTAAQSELLQQWAKWGFPAEVIYMAYEKMANAVSRISFPYMHKILQDWHENNLHTPQDVKAYLEKPRKEKSPIPKNGKGGQASYDLDKFKERSLHPPSGYKKKEAAVNRKGERV